MSAVPTAVLMDLDHISYTQQRVRGADHDLESTIKAVERWVAAIGSDVFFTFGACSTETAERHSHLLCRAAANRWCMRKGIDGADDELLLQIDFLRQRGRARRLVIVAGDHTYAPALRALNTSGIETVVIGRAGATSRVLAAQAKQVVDLSALLAPQGQAA